MLEPTVGLGGSAILSVSLQVELELRLARIVAANALEDRSGLVALLGHVPKPRVAGFDHLASSEHELAVERMIDREPHPLDERGEGEALEQHRREDDAESGRDNELPARERDSRRRDS